MAPVRTKKRTAAAADRLINRELSFLDYDARLLELVQDADLPLLERVFFCAIFSQMLDEFFMVRIAGLTGQAAAGVTVRSPDGRTPQQALDRRAEARDRAVRGAGARLVARARAGARRGGDRRLARRRAVRRGAPRARGDLRAGHLPGADAARGRARPAVPVHLRALDQPRRVRARPGDERGAVRAREGARGPAALPAGRPRGTARAARAGAHGFPAEPLPGDGGARALALPRHARRRLRGLRRGRRPARGGRGRAAPRPLRRGDAARGLRLDVAVAARAPAAGPRRRGRSRLPDRRHVRPRRRDGADEGRPARPEERSVDPGRPAAARRPRGGRAVRRDPRRRHPRAPPVRLVRGELRVVPQRERGGPGRDRAEVDGVPHRRRHAARPRSDRGVGARQAERLPRRDQGARRRATQHRMVPRTRAGGRARRLRVPHDEDPREDDARRPARGRRAAPLRPPRHRQLQQRHGPRRTRTSASSPPTRTSPPTSPTCSTT